MYILPQKNIKIVDSSVCVCPIIGKSDYVSRRYGGAFNFGYIGPGQTSKTIITYLSLSGIAGIKNIKLSITEAGELDFCNQCFAYDTLDYLDVNFSPKLFFTGFNTTFNKQSMHNIPVENRNPLSSKFVYLNITLPESVSFWKGLIKYAWFFDYA